jgi:phosphoenolpyruvate-protein kinase (PTS system EI component)
MTTYRGTPVSAGVAAGELYLPDVSAAEAMGARAGAADGGAASSPPATVTATVTAADVRAAFAAVAADRRALAAQLRAAGRGDEADIVTIGALMAADPALSGPALDALATPAAGPAAASPAAGPAATGRVAGGAEHAPVRDDPGRFPLATAAAAITAAAQAQAAILEALPDPDLAQRAGDVRQVAAAVTAALAGDAAAAPPRAAFILVRAEVDPADLIRLADAGHLAGAVSAGGGASSHAAIIARGLGLPMLAAADPAVTSAAAGHLAVLDADRGELRTDPAPADLARVRTAGHQAPTDLDRGARGSARTADGALVTILCNVASAAETRLGLANGAAGVGLLRTEIPFTRAAGWPTRAEHLAALAPVLRLLRGRRAVVRLLDFAGDKVPPFPGAAGLPAFLRAPGALSAQLAAILQAGAGTELAVMIPMVRALDEVELVRAELARAAKAAGAHPPPLGMMVELAATAAAAPAFAGSVDFFSIGTNDLTADVLRRERSALRPADASEREVLTAVASVIAAAGEAGIGLSVCGDAAADPAVLPRLLALGVRTVSVGAARVPAVARWIAQARASGPPGPGPGGTGVPDAG